MADYDQREHRTEVNTAKLNVGILCSVPDSFLETPSSLSFQDVLVLSSLTGGSFVVSCTSSCSSPLPPNSAVPWASLLDLFSACTLSG